jgi:transposase
VEGQPLSKAALARTFGVSLRYLKGMVRRQKAGRPQALPHAGGPQPKLEAAQREPLRQHVLSHADATWAEVQAWLQTTCQVTLSLSALCRVLQRLDLPRKKDPARHGTRHRRPPAATGRVAH